MHDSEKFVIHSHLTLKSWNKVERSIAAGVQAYLGSLGASVRQNLATQIGCRLVPWGRFHPFSRPFVPHLIQEQCKHQTRSHMVWDLCLTQILWRINKPVTHTLKQSMAIFLLSHRNHIAGIFGPLRLNVAHGKGDEASHCLTPL